MRTLKPSLTLLPSLTLALALGGVSVMTAAAIVSCSQPPTAKDAGAAAKQVVSVTDDACKVAEAVDPALPDWVTLICKVDGAVDGATQKIHMPKAAWMTAKTASKGDAGPGK